MLSRVGIKRFRLLRDVVLDLPRGYPLVLIGPNASGKSTILEVLHLISKAASEEKGLLSSFQHMGGLDRVRTSGERGTICLDFMIEPAPGSPIERDGGSVKYSLEVGELRGALRVEKELVEVFKRGSQAPPLVALSRQGGSVTVHNVSTGKNDVIPVGNDELAWFEIRQPQLYPTLGNVRTALREIAVHASFFWPPAWVRDSRETSNGPRISAMLSQQQTLDPRGLELIPALYNLKEEHPARWEQLQQSFQAEFPFVQRLVLPTDVGVGRVGLAFVDQRFGDVKVYAQEWSDGMLTYLCVLAAVLLPQRGTAIALDEPDAHLHPSVQRRIVSLLEELAGTRSVVVATHSDGFLDHFSDPVKSIRVCETTADGMKIKSLNVSALEAWLKDYTISELRRRGQIDPANADRCEDAIDMFSKVAIDALCERVPDLKAVARLILTLGGAPTPLAP